MRQGCYLGADKDGEQLCEILKQLKLGVRVEMVEKPVIDVDWLARV